MLRGRSWYMLVGAAVVAGLVGLPIGQAQDKKPEAEAEAPKIDPKVTEVFDRLDAFVAKHEAFRFSLAAQAKAEINERKQEQSVHYVMTLQRPNRLSAVVQPGDSGTTVISDGKNAVIYPVDDKKYVIEEAPAQLKPLMANVGQMPALQLGMLASAALMEKKPSVELLEGVSEGTYVGTEKLAGVECHRLRLQQDADLMDWEIWIEAGERPLIHKIAVDYSRRLKAMGPRGEGIKIAMDAVMTDWAVDPALKETDFAFTAPQGVKKVRSLDEHALLGEVAPVFDLDLLDGGHMQLADHKGKEIVILDFWATWCGPCVRALPTISKVAEKYREKGVAFYAVNIDEMPEDVTKFLEEKELKLTVAMDKGGKVAELYKVEGIPQTVIVGKDGLVQVVHIGASNKLEDELSKELEELLAGKSLAAGAE